LGTLTFTGYKEYATFNIGSDPGSGWALGAAILAIAGLCLSLFVRRRRVWVRVIDDGSFDESSEASGPRVRVEVAGLARTEAPGLDELLNAVLQRDPDHRINTAEEIAQYLDAILAITANTLLWRAGAESLLEGVADELPEDASDHARPTLELLLDVCLYAPQVFASAGAPLGRALVAAARSSEGDGARDAAPLTPGEPLPLRLPVPVPVGDAEAVRDGRGEAQGEGDGDGEAVAPPAGEPLGVPLPLSVVVGVSLPLEVALGVSLGVAVRLGWGGASAGRGALVGRGGRPGSFRCAALVW
jgi:hypothetical protein